MRIPRSIAPPCPTERAPASPARRVGFTRLIATACLALAWAGRSAGGEPRAQVIARGLDNPCGLAVQPGTGHLFVSTHPAVERLVCDAKTSAWSRHIEIQGFATDTYGRGPEYEIGPLGLAFLDRHTLIVGGGELMDGDELVRFFAVGDTPRPAGKALGPDDATSHAGPIAPGDDSLRGEGNFFGVAVKGPNVFVTSNGDDTKGWISRIELKGGQSGPLTPFIASKQETGVDGPTGTTISPDGKLVVCQFGEVNLPGDALLVVYDPDTGALESTLKTGLNDLAGVAYSPKTGALYGVDFSWSTPEQGGLFRLDVQGGKVKTTRIARLDHPSALTFAPGGALFVSAIGLRGEPGSADEAGQTPPGIVLRFEGL